MEKAALFWSGGKDCALALHYASLQKHLIVECLVTTLNKGSRRISMHGTREVLLEKQAAAAGIKLIKMWVGDNAGNDDYERSLLQIYARLKEEGISTIIYGDIYLEDLRSYREGILRKAGLKAYYLLWKKDTGQLVCDFLSAGFRSVTVCVSDRYFDLSWLGKEINEDFIHNLPPGADPCGENGEYHTFCFDGPVFNNEIAFSSGGIEYRPLKIDSLSGSRSAGFWFLDLM